ncbi:MAG: amidohydrolase [Desulfobacteraceae bacterium]|nr:amidohydrolase [Desulfobacteraceae bacterium]
MGVEQTYMIDSVIHNGLIVTADPSFRIIENGGIGICDGKIVSLWKTDHEQPLPQAHEIFDAQGGIIMPGLINAHTHLPMSIFRGLSDDLPLHEWLHEHIFPAEAAFISPQSVELGARLSCAELLLNGVTTCCDGYFLADNVAQAVIDSGIRAVVGQGVVDFPAPGVADPSQNVSSAVSFTRRWKNKNSLLQPSIFCHAPYTCSAETLKAAKKAADRHDLLFQIHVCETRAEVIQCKKDHGCSPVQYLHQLGLLNCKTLLVHAVWLDEDDIQIIADCASSIAHCPESNMKLASGIAPVEDFLCAGITVGLGTDGCASNNDLDLLAELDVAAKLHKIRQMDPTALNAATAVKMVTLEGAKALGLAQSIGSLEPGKCADVVIVDTLQPHLKPLFHPESHLVYTAKGSDVRHVMVDGKWVVRDGKLLTLDLPSLLENVNRLAETIAERNGLAKCC